jgi:colanic acid biosynthesis glycosyl transferase WcaI
MAHILFITPYFPPENGAAAVRVSETAVRLVRRAHQVTVLTTVPNYPTGNVPPKYRGHLIQEEVIDGVRVVRAWSYTSRNKGFLRRILAQLSFGCLAPILGGKAVGCPDVIILESHPLFNAISGRLLAWRKRCPFVLMVSDLWPESAIQLGMLHNRLLIRLAEWLEWSTYHRASLIWAVTEGIRQSLLRRGLPAEHVFLLTNGVDTKKFRPLSQAQARAKLGWDSRFTVLYAGTHGLSQGLATVLEAAEQLQSERDIGFVLVGDGATKADLVAQAQERDLKNVSFLEPQPHERMPLILAGADICLVPLRKVPLFEGALPSKMYEAMACARPILLGVDGEARRLAEQEAGAAMYVEPENAEALVSAILYLQRHPEEAELLGVRGRAYVEARFDRDRLTAELEARLATLLERKHGAISIASAPVALPSTSAPNSIPVTSMREEVAAEKSIP